MFSCRLLSLLLPVTGNENIFKQIDVCGGVLEWLYNWNWVEDRLVRLVKYSVSVLCYFHPPFHCSDFCCS